MIALSQEKYDEIQAKIAELKKSLPETKCDAFFIVYSTLQTLEQIIEQAVILPVEKSWDTALFNSVAIMDDDGNAMEILYPNGVLIIKK